MARLLVLTELFLPTKGGTAVWAAEVYKRLGGRGIHIVTADVPGSADVDCAHPNSVHRLSMRRHPWMRPESLAIYLRLLARAGLLAVTHRFDAVHAFRALPEGLCAWLVARLTFRPLVVYAHGEELTTWGRSWKYRAMRFVLVRAERVIANSEHTCDTLVKMGISRGRIAIIYPGVDVNVFRPGLDVAGLCDRYGFGADKPLLFSVGRLSRRKGFDQAIRAVARLREQGMAVEYVIGGVGEDHAYLGSIIAELGAGDCVRLIGAVAEGDLPLWLNACDVFVMPNREIDGDNEGFGMVFIEAAACGKPSLAGIAGGTGAAVIDGVTGVRVDGTSVADIADGIRRLIVDPAVARSMGEAGRARVLSTFAWEHVAARTLKESEGWGRV